MFKNKIYKKSDESAIEHCKQVCYCMIGKLFSRVHKQFVYER